MRSILITGKNSYIGTSLKKWLEKNNSEYNVEEIETQNEEWQQISFSKYDAILHVAGIAHVSTDPELEGLYYKVNRDLAIEVAKKAKKDGAKQFIFMSSMIIYGNDAKIGENKVIDGKSNPEPRKLLWRQQITS